MKTLAQATKLIGFMVLLIKAQIVGIGFG